MLGKCVAILMAAAAVLLMDSSRAEACSCLPPTVESSYNNADEVWHVRVLSKQIRRERTTYHVLVLDPLKGCARAGSRLRVVTPTDSATCGISLEVGQEYLLNGHRDGRQFSVNLCDYNIRWSALSESDSDFLFSRYNCCRDSCECTGGSQPVQCFADPCEVSPPCPDGQCVANYCGGCRAEYYDQWGQRVCQACSDDSQCTSGASCQPTESGTGQCVAPKAE